MIIMNKAYSFVVCTSLNPKDLVVVLLLLKKKKKNIFVPSPSYVHELLIYYVTEYQGIAPPSFQCTESD